MYKKSQVLRSIRKEMDAGNLFTVSLRRLHISRQVLKKWRDNRPLIDRYIKALMHKNDEIREDIVEDAYFKKLAAGKGSAADYEFYLTNRRPNKWKRDSSVIIDQSQHTHLTKVTTNNEPSFVINPVSPINRILKKANE